MYLLKTLSFIFIMTLTLSSCSEKDTNTSAKKIDTLKDNSTKAKDTVILELSPGDSIFDNSDVKFINLKNKNAENLNDKMEDFLDIYIDIKDDLADNDSVSVKENAIKALDLIVKYSNDSSVSVNKQWILTEKKAAEYRDKIMSANTLKKQREWFSKLSESFSGALTEYGFPGDKIYELSSTSTDLPYKNWFTDSKETDDPYSNNGDEEDSILVVNTWEYKK